MNAALLDAHNILLRAMGPETLDLMAPSLQRVALPYRYKLADARVPADWVFFPESGIVSVIGEMGETWQEVGLFGRDGVGCISTVIGAKRPPYAMLMQIEGEGYRIPVRTISALFRSDRVVQDVLLRYTQSLMVQITQSTLANTQFNVEQRLARWFLMIHDRIDGDVVKLTHEYLAIMLGVGRTAVTLALHALERAGLITTARGQTTIADRAGLEAMTAPLYGFAEAEYAKLFDATLRGMRVSSQAS